MATEAERRIPAWVAPASIAATCLVAGVNATRYLGFYSDDAFISLRYAQRLLEGKGLTWTDGEWVEGYSNLGWILMVAALGVFGIDLVVATRILGMLSMFAVIALLSVGSDGRPDVRRALSGGLFAATTWGLGVWATAGLAQTFVAFLGVAGVLAARWSRDGGGQKALAALLVFSLVATVNRIDGFILVGAVLVGAVAAGLSFRTAAKTAAVSVFAFVAQEVFRVVYYEDWVSNTARVKVSFTLSRAWRGAEWVGSAMLDHIWLVVPALIGLALLRRRSIDAALAALVWVAYTTYVGGDIFFGYRIVLPAFPLLALIVSDLGERYAKAVPVLAITAVVHGAWHFAVDPQTLAPTKPKHWVFQTKGPAEAMRDAWGAKDPLIAIDAAGALPYYCEFDAVDMLGLTDRFLAMHPPPGWGKGGIGHDLGDGGYIWGRKPDILAFSSGLGGRAVYLSARQIITHPQWGFFYRPVFVGAPDEDGDMSVGHYIVRARDSKLGIVRTPDRIEAPGYFFTSPKVPAVLRDGELGPILPVGEHPAGLLAPPGTWSIRAIGSNPVDVVPNEVVHGHGRIEVKLRTKEPDTHLKRLVLERVAEPPPDLAPPQ